MNSNVLKAKVKTDNISCPICYNILKEPVECLICHHNFCKECYDKRIQFIKDNNLEVKCALCNKNVNGEWKTKKNFLMLNLLKKIQNQNIKCKNCGKQFNNENEKLIHEKICILHKCKICHKSLFNEIFLKHIEEHQNELDELIDLFNKNYNKKFLAPNSLYYCYNKTNLNCNCCDGICHMGSCLCVDCMNENKQIKQLNPKYLINKSGKAAKYKNNNSFYCKTQYYTTLDKNRTKENKILCYPPNEPCPECKILTKLMKTYLNSDIYNSLIYK
jgi:hypothetical protein